MGHRFNDHCIEFSNPSEETVSILKQYLSSFRGVVCCGLPGSGKTSFLDKLYQGENRITRWDRSQIYKMMFGSFIDFGFSSHLDTFESAVFDKLLAEHDHPVCFEGWLTTSKGRSAVKRLFGSWRVALLVFDGPTERLIARHLQTESLVWTRKETPIQMRILHQSFQYPTQREGWGAVIYVNTMGDEGIEYYEDLLAL